MVYNWISIPQCKADLVENLVLRAVIKQNLIVGTDWRVNCYTYFSVHRLYFVVSTSAVGRYRSALSSSWPLVTFCHLPVSIWKSITYLCSCLRGLCGGGFLRVEVAILGAFAFVCYKQEGNELKERVWKGKEVLCTTKVLGVWCTYFRGEICCACCWKKFLCVVHSTASCASFNLKRILYQESYLLVYRNNINGLCYSWVV